MMGKTKSSKKETLPFTQGRVSFYEIKSQLILERILIIMIISSLII